MSITFSCRIVSAVAGAALAVGAQALAPQPGGAATAAASHPAGVTVLQDATSNVAQAAAVRYWTPARMAAALRGTDRVRRLVRKAPPPPKSVLPKSEPRKPEPRKPEPRKPEPRKPEPRKPEPRKLALPGPWLTGDTAGYGLRWTHANATADAVGKIFFTLDGEDYVCSGALVGGKHSDVVLTAAHCVTSSTGQGGPGQANGPKWATNWMFVPGFRDGLLPYGEYTARQFFVTPDWTGTGGGSEQYDIAFVQVTAATLDGWSGVAQSPPGLPVEFAGSQDAAPADRAYVFGYPSEPPYTGQYLNYCAGSVAASGGGVRTACGMTAGDSGGPWLAGFSPRSGAGPVVAVSTYKISDNLRVLYGALLGPQARALYERAVRSAG